MKIIECNKYDERAIEKKSEILLLKVLHAHEF